MTTAGNKPQVTAAGALFAALLLASCGLRPSEANAPAQKASVPVKLGQVTVGEIRSTLTYNGDLAPKYTVSVLPKATGTIRSLNVDLGSQVKKGDVIAQLEHTELDAQLAQARANRQAAQAKLSTVNAQGRPEQVAQAQAQLDAANAKLQQLLNGATPAQVQQAKLAVEQAKDKLFADQTANDRLVGSGVISKEMRQSALDVDQTGIDQANAALNVLVDPPTADQVNQARAAVRAAESGVGLAAKPYTSQDAQAAAAGMAQAQAAVDLVQTQLDYATVTAPVDGMVAKKLANQGDTATPTTPLVTLVSAQWEVAVQVAELSIAQVHQGDRVMMTAAAFPSAPFVGFVSLVAPVIDPQTRTFTVKIEPSGNLPDVRGGMSTRIDIPAAVHSGVRLLPKSAVLSKDGRNVAFTVQEGQAHATALTIGLTDDQNAEVLAGLEPGQAVVISGQELLNDQDPVQIQGG